MPEPVLAYLIGWPAFIGIVLTIVGWKVWSSVREVRKYQSNTKADPREKPAASEVAVHVPETPEAVSKILANWIISTCKIERFTLEQNVLLNKTNRIVELYHAEIICLATFAVRTSIGFQLDDDEKARLIFEDVLLEVRGRLAEQKFVYVLYSRILFNRLNAYEEVLAAEVRRDPETTSPIALKFLNFIVPPEENKRALEKGGAPYYDSEGKLIKPPAFEKLQEKIHSAARLTDISMNYYFMSLEATKDTLAREDTVPV